ncbi:unnamed protein product [Vicia faba]|uniref:Uncharacterized protein n=1 Tax=Vicia faba TaxID=3906 RepID=A0AAV0YMI4_VICFA|nr:unnamed protein product [Vicia faba]
MALTTNKVSSGPILTNRTTLCKSNGEHYFPSSARINRVQFSKVRLEHRHQSNGFMLNERSTLFNDWFVNGKPVGLTSKTSPVSCKSTGANNTEEKECVTTSEHAEDGKNDRAHSVRGLAEAYRFACNDARFLSRGIMRMDARARQDVAFLGTEFLKLDARARKDTEKIDRGVKEKAKRLNRIATILKDIAESRLKSAADKHWSDGALEVNLLISNLSVLICN